MRTWTFVIAAVTLATGAALGQEPVKGAPFAAEAVNETTQILADGTRLTSKTSTKVYRDSQGRVRREAELNQDTGLSVTPNRNPTVSISDPVAGVDYILDVLRHTAVRVRKLSTPPPPFGNSGAGNPAGGLAPAITFEPTPGPSGAKASQWIIVQGNHTESTGPSPFPAAEPPVPATRVESPEPRTIEGLRAEGSRTVETIPAGRAGNDQPVEIVNEMWFSPDLQANLLTRRTDPHGETVYRLTNINRAEPSAFLFLVPPDYAISEAPSISGGIVTGGVTVGPISPAR